MPVVCGILSDLGTADAVWVSVWKPMLATVLLPSLPVGSMQGVGDLGQQKWLRGMGMCSTYGTSGRLPGTTPSCAGFAEKQNQNEGKKLTEILTFLKRFRDSLPSLCRHWGGPWQDEG